MPLGILDVPGEHVPGTVYVYEQESRTAELLDRDATLHRSKDGRTILVPQPNRNDPNDPLNWPLWKRDMMLAVLCLVAVIASTATPLLAADTITVALFFRRNFGEGAKLTAYHLAGAAVSAWIFVPFARVWGKRSTFMFASLLMVGSSVWGGETSHNRHHYGQMVWARVLQGAAVAPFESLLNTCVGDLYYVHERGPRMVMTNVCLFAGAFLTPVFVGMIVNDVRFGWRWTFYFLAIFEAMAFVLMFFLVPETAYRRPLQLETDITAQHINGDAFDPPAYPEGRRSDEKRLNTFSIVDETPVARRPYWKQLLPFDGRKTDEWYIILALRPIPLFFHPAILWGCLLQGLIIGWTVMVGVIISLIFIGPPLFWGEKKTGEQYTAAVIGSIVGLIGSGVFSEVVTKFLIKRNNGKYEPEFRLWLVLPTMITAGIGLYGFGITAADVATYGHLRVDVFLGMIVLSMVAGTVASAQYILDAHRDIAIEAFTNMIVFKNIFSFILAYFAYGWVTKSGGVRTMFIAFGSIQVAICLLTIPMYVFGKRNRAFFHRHDLLKMARLR